MGVVSRVDPILRQPHHANLLTIQETSTLIETPPKSLFNKHFLAAKIYARISRTTLVGSTPVSRCWSPWNLNVRRLWSIPNVCRIVALRSRM